MKRERQIIKALRIYRIRNVAEWEMAKIRQDARTETAKRRKGK